jgi:hypothetical protein
MEEDRRAHKLCQELRRRRAARLQREGHPPPHDLFNEREDLSGLGLAEILLVGRKRAHERRGQ